MQELQHKTKLSSDLSLFLILVAVLLFLLVFMKDAYLSILLIPLFLVLIFMRKRIIISLNVNNIAIKRKFSKLTTIEGGEIEVSLEVSNNSNFDTQLIELVDTIPEQFELIEGTHIFLFDLIKNESIVLKYKVCAKSIGIFEFGNIFIRESDFFGLLINSFNFIIENPEQLIVSPKFERLEKLPIHSYWLKFFSGVYVSKQFGQDSEFKGLREYHYGDKLQNINWKATSRYQSSRMQSLISNEFSFDSVVEFEIIFDLSYESYITYVESIRVCATIVEYLLRTKNKVGLTIAKEYPEYIKSKIGARQYSIIRDKLLNTKADEEKNTELIIDRLLNISTVYNKKAIILLITPSLNESIINYAGKMKQHNHNILIIQPNAAEKQLTAIEDDSKLLDISKSVPLFYNLTTFDILQYKELTADQLLKYGVPVLNWNMKTPITRIFFKKQIVNK